MRPARPSRAARGRRITALVGAAAFTATALVAGAAEADPVPAASFRDGRYLVQFSDEPVAVYDGGLTGLAATAPDEGETIDQDSPQVEEYRDHLAEVRDDVLAEVQGVTPDYEFDTVFNGVAVELTAAEAAELAGHDRVAGVFPDRREPLQMDASPEFLGLSGAGGSWETEFGGGERAGEGVIIGVVDDGYWPEHPHFAPMPEPRPDQEIIDAKWSGECVEGEEKPEDNVTCNNKVIGARWYDAEGLAADGVGLASPRSDWTHGTHIGSIAAGNWGTDLVLDGESQGTVSGLAPAARLAFYKACWGTPFGGPSGCAISDTVAAFDDAVNDGVDVINFSVHGARSSVNDPVSIAMFNASAAGVFVATIAGNQGFDGPATVNHNSPWATTVAASTHPRAIESELSLGDGRAFPYGTIGGWSSADKELDLVLAEEAALDGADPGEARLCLPGTLDAETVSGRAVACAQGEVMVFDKGEEVLDAGGAAMVVYNDDPEADDIRTSSWDAPIVAANIDVEAGDALEAYAAGNAEATVTLHRLESVEHTAPEMAPFSSVGPSLVPDGDLLKPDITAPGVQVLAAYAPDWMAGDDDFGIMSGTSMSSPHVAGLAALLMSANPDWSPMTVKSALMTTAYQVDTAGEPIQRGGEDATPFDFGAGHADGRTMFDPGLVYDSGVDDWIGYGCAIGQFQQLDEGATCQANEAEYGAIDPSDLNYPSIAVNDLVGVQTITRTVTNVDDRYGFYVPEIEAPAGFEVTVDRTWLRVAPGASMTYTLTVTRTDAVGEWSFGSLTWRDWYGHEVHSPIAVRYKDVAAPQEVLVSGPEGSIEIGVRTGIEAPLEITASGPVASEVETLTLSGADKSTFPRDSPPEREQTKAFEFTVPADAVTGRLVTVDADYEAGTDLDLFAYTRDSDGSLALYDETSNAGSDEVLDLEPGLTYVIYVDLWSAPVETVEVSVHTWALPEVASGLTVTPDSIDAAPGGEYTVTASWSDLDPEGRYLAAVNYFAGEDLAGRTIVVLNH